MNLYTVRAYAKAIRYGSKYVYQTVPRLLTIWLDMGEDRNLAGSDVFKKLNDVVAKAIKDAPVYKVNLLTCVLSVRSLTTSTSGLPRSPRLSRVWAILTLRSISIFPN